MTKGSVRPPGLERHLPLLQALRPRAAAGRSRGHSRAPRRVAQGFTRLCRADTCWGPASLSAGDRGDLHHCQAMPEGSGREEQQGLCPLDPWSVSPASRDQDGTEGSTFFPKAP